MAKYIYSFNLNFKFALLPTLSYELIKTIRGSIPWLSSGSGWLLHLCVRVCERLGIENIVRFGLEALGRSAASDISV